MCASQRIADTGQFSLLPSLYENKNAWQVQNPKILNKSGSLALQKSGKSYRVAKKREGAKSDRSGHRTVQTNGKLQGQGRRTGRTRKQVDIKLQPVTRARCSETSAQLGG